LGSFDEAGENTVFQCLYRMKTVQIIHKIELTQLADNQSIFEFIGIRKNAVFMQVL
jgi:hypothetical protein